ncbi:hypothetical protein D9X30_1254 [Cupriavidus sp. U2]|nr:hypothetical protein D9X30_1254 [Cupriavidus sp. U2]
MKFILISVLCELLFGNIAMAEISHESSANNSYANVRVVGPCRFRMEDLFGGRLATYKDKEGIYFLPWVGPQRFKSGSFSLSCVKATDEKIAIYLDGKLIDGRWWRCSSYPCTEMEPYEKKANAKTVPLKGRNWLGIAYTADDTTGDERKRARRFRFCLVHEKNALCGRIPVQWLSNPKGRDDLPRIKAILESVEFVDPVDLPTTSTDGPPAVVTEGR